METLVLQKVKMPKKPDVNIDLNQAEHYRAIQSNQDLTKGCAQCDNAIAKKL
jgi:hypothetical protein